MPPPAAHAAIFSSRNRPHISSRGSSAPRRYDATQGPGGCVPLYPEADGIFSGLGGKGFKVLIRHQLSILGKIGREIIYRQVMVRFNIIIFVIKKGAEVNLEFHGIRDFFNAIGNVTPPGFADPGLGYFPRHC